MIKTPQIILATAIAAVFGGNAFAADKIVLASLGDVNGKVLVNQGKGFVSAKDGMQMSTGDRVVALEKASAKVVYKDGCVTSLKENKVLAMDAKGCDKQAVNAGSENIKLAQALGGTMTDAAPGSGDLASGTGGGGLSGPAIAGTVVGVVFVGGLIAANNNNNNNDNRPVSGQ